VRESYTHRLSTLVKIAGLNTLLNAECTSDALFEVNWTTAKDWSEKGRYVEHSEIKARSLYRALTDSKHGVMRWVKQHW
jgi:hypothetical protein